MHAIGKYLQDLMGPAIDEGSFKWTKKKTTNISLTWPWRVCFVSVAQVKESRMYAYNELYFDKIVDHCLVKDVIFCINAV